VLQSFKMGSQGSKLHEDLRQSYSSFQWTRRPLMANVIRNGLYSISTKLLDGVPAAQLASRFAQTAICLEAARLFIMLKLSLFRRQVGKVK